MIAPSDEPHLIRRDVSEPVERTVPEGEPQSM
jgi:hypothetical protein